MIIVIPARGGSKRLPRKNARELAGKPLVNYTIEAALDANVSGTLVVSTDDQEIAQISKDAGAQVVMRPDELATDNSSTESVLSLFL